MHPCAHKGSDASPDETAHKSANEGSHNKKPDAAPYSSPNWGTDIGCYDCVQWVPANCVGTQSMQCSRHHHFEYTKL